MTLQDEINKGGIVVIGSGSGKATAAITEAIRQGKKKILIVSDETASSLKDISELVKADFAPVFDKPEPIILHNYHAEVFKGFPPKSGQEKRRDKRAKNKKRVKNKRLG